MFGASVVFDSSTAFTGLLGTHTTNGSGEFSVSGLTAVLSGEQQLSAKVNGKTTTKTKLNITVATYVLTADRDKLNQHEEHDVTFTLTRNGETVPSLERWDYQTGNSRQGWYMWAGAYLRFLWEKDNHSFLIGGHYVNAECLRDDYGYEGWEGFRAWRSSSGKNRINAVYCLQAGTLQWTRHRPGNGKTPR